VTSGDSGRNLRLTDDELLAGVARLEPDPRHRIAVAGLEERIASGATWRAC